ncbi:MAG: transcriptional regulator, TetR family [Bacillota bacterium]|jgi:AcrR family transcriptional regulator|nr:transcriptional regulator, TetR family [Bacillota bacterium]
MAGDTRNNILECGREEFLEKGYEGASLRRIAKAAGVTTGAIYGYFPDKKAIFEALTGAPAKELLDYYITVQRKFAELPGDEQGLHMADGSEAGLIWMLDYIYQHFEAFKLLICSSAGTEYEGYLNGMVEIETKATFQFIAAVRKAGWQINDVDEELVHMLSSSFFYGIFEIVAHDMPKERAEGYIHNLLEFTKAGWTKLLDLKPPVTMEKESEIEKK